MKKSMKRFILVFVLSVWAVRAQIHDQTLIPDSSGSEVVEAVVGRIRESCLFPDDKLFLRRLAYVASHDGADPDTYTPASNGGIWHIHADQLNATKHMKNVSGLYEDILDKFGISWSSVRWMDLRKPLYSGLAAALYLTTLSESVPQKQSEQSHFYAKYVNISPASETIFEKRSKAFDIVCRRTNLDLAFLVDASSSLSPEDFDSAKQFAHSVVDDFQIGRDDIRIAFVSFSTGFKSHFDFNSYQDKASLQTAIDAIQKSEGQTDTDVALNFASEHLFTPAMGSREGSSKVILLITDGKSTKNYRTIPAALRARSKGIVIFAIGVGSDVDAQELIDVANSPQCTHVIQLTDYSHLAALVSQIQQVSCRAPAVLSAGQYTYSCANNGLYQIPMSGSPTQVTLTTTDGMVNIYGSLSNPTPNNAGHSFYSNTIPSTASVILIEANSKGVYVNISSALQHACTGNYTIQIGSVSTVAPDTYMTCVHHDDVGPCSVAELYRHLYQQRPASSYFSTICQRGPASFQPHPSYQTQFLYCGSNGTAFVFLCPLHQVFQPARDGCAPGEPTSTTPSAAPVSSPTTPTSTPSTPTTPTSTPLTPTTPSQAPTTTTAGSASLTTTMRSTETVTLPPTTTISTTRPLETTTTAAFTQDPIKPVDNPCTPDNISKHGGLYLYPHPKDESKYIDCTNWPSLGYVKSCPSGKLWEQKYLTCVHVFVVIDPLTNSYDKIPNPCRTAAFSDLMIFFPHPLKKNYFIQCDQFGNGFEKMCPENKTWHQEVVQCIQQGLFLG